MSVSFKIDGATMPLDPEDVKWESVDWISRKHGGGPLVNAKRTVHLRWESMVISDFSTLAGYCTSGTHTLTVPHPDTGTYTLFAVAFLKMSDWEFKDVHVERVEIEASFITV